jgi:hypothetical protein
VASAPSGIAFDGAHMWACSQANANVTKL